MAEEVALDDDSGDYELVPMGPLRRLEKRLEKMEKEHDVESGEKVVDDMLDILKSNQSLFNQLVETNVSLQEKIDDLLDELREVADGMNEFLELLEAASETPGGMTEVEPGAQQPSDSGGSGMADVAEKMSDTLEQVVASNKDMAESLDRMERRMKKLYTNQKTGEERGVGLDVERSGAAELLADESQQDEDV